MSLLTKSLAVVLQSLLQLVDGFVAGTERGFAVSAEVVGGMAHIILRAFELFNGFADLWMAFSAALVRLRCRCGDWGCGWSNGGSSGRCGCRLRASGERNAGKAQGCKKGDRHHHVAWSHDFLRMDLPQGAWT